jgi:hypothetical protein
MSMSSGQLDSIDNFSSISVNDASSRLVSFAIVQQQADALYANSLLPYIYIRIYKQVLLLPIYFAISGLKTDFSALNTGKLWGFAVLVRQQHCIDAADIEYAIVTFAI